MNLLGFEITRKRNNQTLSPALSSGGGWFSALFPFVVRESNPGDWQRNVCYSAEVLLGNSIVFACITLIAGDIAKLPPMLMQYDDRNEIDVEVRSNAFSPVLEKPNPYQNRIDFFTQWLISLLAYGNTYVLKVRDNRSVVTRLYILDPRRVMPLIAPGGEVFYELSQDNLADVAEQVIVPASEIIHDKINPLFHPLVGLSPLFGCGGAATQGIEMQRNSTRFFRKGATPSGIITIPGSVDPAKAQKIKDAWAGGFTGDNAGAVAILADGARFEQMTMKSTDSELVNQIKMTNEQITACFHVPSYMVGVGSAPAYNNIEALNQQYYNQCLQVRIEQIEECLGLGLGILDAGYKVKFDLRQLLRMDTAARYEANAKAINGGWLAPNEARKGDNLRKVKGGETPYLQQQNYSLAALAKRDASEDPFKSSGGTSNGTSNNPNTPPGPAQPDQITPPEQRSIDNENVVVLTQAHLTVLRNNRRLTHDRAA